jgi:hypothetical protein
MVFVRKFGLAIALGSVLLMPGFTAAAGVRSSGWTHYVSFRYPFNIDYPSQWEVHSSQKVSGVDKFQAPPWKASSVDFSVAPTYAGGWVTLADVKADEVTTVKTCGGRVLTSDRITFAGHAAWRLVSSCPILGVRGPFEMTVVFLAKHKRWWLAYITFLQGDYVRYLPTARRMFSSFRLLG